MEEHTSLSVVKLLITSKAYVAKELLVLLTTDDSDHCAGTYHTETVGIKHSLQGPHYAVLALVGQPIQEPIHLPAHRLDCF